MGVADATMCCLQHVQLQRSQATSERGVLAPALLERYCLEHGAMTFPRCAMVLRVEPPPTNKQQASQQRMARQESKGALQRLQPQRNASRSRRFGDANYRDSKDKSKQNEEAR